MSTGVITSFTLIDFLNESEMTAFFVFMEKHTDALASELRANGMTKFMLLGSLTKMTNLLSATGWNTKTQSLIRLVMIFGQNS